MAKSCSLSVPPLRPASLGILGGQHQEQFYRIKKVADPLMISALLAHVQTDNIVKVGTYHHQCSACTFVSYTFVSCLKFPFGSHISFGNRISYGGLGMMDYKIDVFYLLYL